jgi:hypothetical protein
MSRLAAIGPRADEPEPILWADESGLRGLIAALRAGTETDWSLEAPPSSGPGAPLDRLVVAVSDGPLIVQASATDLQLTGSTASLRQLANYLEHYADQNDLTESQMHTHVWDHPAMPWIGVGTELEVAGWWPDAY